MMYMLPWYPVKVGSLAAWFGCVMTLPAGGTVSIRFLHVALLYCTV